MDEEEDFDKDFGSDTNHSLSNPLHAHHHQLGQETIGHHFYNHGAAKSCDVANVQHFHDAANPYHYHKVLIKVMQKIHKCKGKKNQPWTKIQLWEIIGKVDTATITKTMLIMQKKSKEIAKQYQKSKL